MKPTLVRWIDAQRIETCLQDIEEVKELEPIPCEIVGFLVHEDEKKIILAQEKWDDEQGVKYLHIIPRACVLSIKELKEISK